MLAPSPSSPYLLKPQHITPVPSEASVTAQACPKPTATLLTCARGAPDAVRTRIGGFGLTDTPPSGALNPQQATPPSRVTTQPVQEPTAREARCPLQPPQPVSTASPSGYQTWRPSWASRSGPAAAGGTEVRTTALASRAS